MHGREEGGLRNAIRGGRGEARHATWSTRRQWTIALSPVGKAMRVTVRLSACFWAERYPGTRKRGSFSCTRRWCHIGRTLAYGANSYRLTRADCSDLQLTRVDLKCNFSIGIGYDLTELSAVRSALSSSCAFHQSARSSAKSSSSREARAHGLEGRRGGSLAASSELRGPGFPMTKCSTQHVSRGIACFGFRRACCKASEKST